MTEAVDADTGTRVEVVALGFLVGEFGPDDAVGHVDGSDWICLRWWWIVGLWVLGGSREVILNVVGQFLVRFWR